MTSVHFYWIVNFLYFSKFSLFFTFSGIPSLLAKGVYDAAFPLHDVSLNFLTNMGDNRNYRLNVVNRE